MCDLAALRTSTSHDRDDVHHLWIVDEHNGVRSAVRASKGLVDFLVGLYSFGDEVVRVR